MKWLHLNSPLYSCTINSCSNEHQQICQLRTRRILCGTTKKFKKYCSKSTLLSDCCSIYVPGSKFCRVAVHWQMNKFEFWWGRKDLTFFLKLKSTESSQKQWLKCICNADIYKKIPTQLPDVIDKIMLHFLIYGVHRCLTFKLCVLFCFFNIKT